MRKYTDNITDDVRVTQIDVLGKTRFKYTDNLLMTSELTEVDHRST